MRCEIAASLLHAPRLLFLDEPTIGLDVSAKAAIRELLRAESEREGVTLLLTSHDTGDIERVCDRVIVIHRGRLLWDGTLAEPAAKLPDGEARHVVDRGRAPRRCECRAFACISSRPYRTELEVDARRDVARAGRRRRAATGRDSRSGRRGRAARRRDSRHVRRRGRGGAS